MEVVEAPIAELTVVERVQVALKSTETEATLVALVKNSADIKEVKNTDGRTQVHAAAMVLKNSRVAITKTGKQTRDEANDFCEKVLAEERRLIAIISGEEDRLFKLRDDFDAKVEAERQAKIAAERARIDAIKARIAFIANAPLTAVGLPSVGIDRVIQSLLSEVLDDSYEEFLPEAQAAHAKALEQLQSAIEAAMHAEQQAAQEAAARAAEAQRIAAEREELAKQRQAQEAEAEASRIALEAERAEIAKQRAAAEEAAAAQRKIEEEKLAEQRAELAVQQAAINAQRREQEEAARVAQAKIDADAKAAADAEAKRLQDAADEALRQQNEEHIKSVNQELHHFLCCDIGMHGDTATQLIAEIAANNAPHLTITY